MNNSAKQAAAFEPKWTCEEPENQTDPDCYHSSSPPKHSPKKTCFDVCACARPHVCLQTENPCRNERMTGAFQSGLGYFLILSGSDREPKQKGSEWIPLLHPLHHHG